MTKAGYWELSQSKIWGAGMPNTLKGTTMRKTLSVSALALGTVLALSACGGSPSATATSPNVEAIAPAETKAPEGPKKSPRGNVIKVLGEAAGQTDQTTKKQTVNFTINSITPDVPCTGSYPQPSKNGHYVVLDVVAETTPDLADAIFPKFDISPYSFSFVAANGTTFNGDLSGNGYMCLAEAEGFPSGGIGPAEKVAAKVVLDVPATTGTLVFKTLGSMSGWEWAF